MTLPSPVPHAATRSVAALPPLFRPLTRGFAVAALAALCAACAPAGRVILLPQPERSSAVLVSTAQGSAELATPYAAAELGHQGEVQPAQSSEAEVRERYPALLRLAPPAPQRFTLNFQPGTSDLTPDSAAQLDQVVAAARARSGGEIVIVGHTDRQGAADANDALSLRRANAIRDLLVGKGFRPELVEPVGRGEREPVVSTDDDVPEPRNRRAEVFVR
ncbi:OmpA family protein [Hydrogenophaga pseudoflava]|uniref:OmpA family protein n=1 Tax=Hydrogenophaga pseudoflava TaxID=47421 RepID=UPI0027E544D1|nr:OmpA family protein [Hydrogenophaga pseudoflava]MDQ7742844.1 OmpA family protein [Hydrogenophaga pseudoflava]